VAVVVEQVEPVVEAVVALELLLDFLLPQALRLL
jgi:hypothetical protein